MDEHMVTVGPNGEVQLPTAICESLGIVRESRVAMWIEDRGLILKLEPSRLPLKNAILL